MMMADDGEQLGLAAEVTIAWLSNPHTRAGADDAATMLGALNAAIRGLGTAAPASAEPEPAAPEHSPAVSVRRSLALRDHIISMIDGKPYRALTRHLSARGLNPEQYRQRYGLKPDYPMVAPGYSEARSVAAKQHNFGRPRTTAAASEPAAPEPTALAKRRRLGISGAKRPAQAHVGAADVGSAPDTLVQDS